jgi:hypothetical protein
VSSSRGCIALTTNNLEVVELPKGFGHSLFRNEEALALFAPSLKIGRVGAVLDEAQDAACGLQVMTADDSAKLLRMGSAYSDRTGVHGFQLTTE